MEISDSAVLAEIVKPSMSAGWLADFDFASGHQYYSDRAHPVVYAGNTYDPLGSLVSVEAIRDSADSKPNGVRLVLSGVDPALTALAVGDTGYYGRTVTLRLAFFDEKDALIGTSDPAVLLMSHPDVKLGKENVVAMNCETDQSRWAQAKPLFSTTASHQRFFSGDQFFDQGPYLLGKSVFWGGYRIGNAHISNQTPRPPPGYRVP